MTKTILALAAIAGLAFPCLTRADAISFESLPLGNPPADGSTQYGATGTHYWNGSNASGSFTAGSGTFSATFVNTFTDWGGGFTSWDGFAYSNTTDTGNGTYENQYSAVTGAGADGSSKYVVGYQPYVGAWNLTLSTPQDLTGRGIMLTNTIYAHHAMQDGYFSAKKFGGVTGNDADWFLLTITGFSGGNSTGTVEFHLADFRFANNALDYIVDDWRFVSLSGLGIVDEIRFAISSSDPDGFGGFNTPAYFAMDDFGVIPEPSSLLLCLGGSIALLVQRRIRKPA